MSPQPSNSDFVRQAYHRILWLAGMMHAAYTILFAALGIWPMAVYNVFSFALYCSLHLLINRGKFREAIITVHSEVAIFACLAVISVGWQYGVQYLLISSATFVYFSPFHNPRFPYYISFIEMLVFGALCVYSYLAPPLLAYPIAAPVVHGVYVVNACSSFLITVVIANMSNVSSALSRKELLEQNATLRRDADYDYLTKLLNRRAFSRNLEQAWEEYRAGGRNFAVALGDLDDFKGINDAHGHECGDLVLSRTASLLQNTFRRDDAVCRWGGEEFMILLHGVDAWQAASLVDRVRYELEHLTLSHNGKIILMTITFGVCSADQVDDIESLLSQADERMYAGKQAGKNKVVAE